MALTGIRADEIGDTYDMAIGYAQPSAGVTPMVGYVLAPTGGFSESTNIQDEDHIVQVASPNTTDRFERYPKVSQGDWSGGERQLIFVDPTKFYLSTGIDASTPGALTLQNNILATQVGGINTAAISGARIGTDGSNWIIGATGTGLGGGVNCITGVNGPASIISSQMGATTPTINDLVNTPGGVFAACSDGIYLVNFSSLATSTKIGSDIPSTNNGQTIAYYNGSMYYATNSSTQVSKVAANAAAAAGTVVYTANAGEGIIKLIAATSNGLLIATGSNTTSPICNESVLYIFDGTTATRIARVPGIVCAAHEMNGVTYILVVPIQGGLKGGLKPLLVTNNTPQYTLLALSGSTVTVVDDLRDALPDFQVAGSIPTTMKCNLADDGRYLYVGFPGINVVAYNPSNGAWLPVNGSTFGNANCHQIAVTNAGLVELTGNHVSSPFSGDNVGITTAVTTPSTGTLTTSYFDFGTPTTNKAFRSIEFDLQTAFVSGQISVSYRTDNNTNWTALSIYVPSSNALVAYLPLGTKGYRIQFQITLTNVIQGSTSNIPIVRSYAVRANLGRVWKVALACRRDQMGRNGVKDPQNLSAMDLLSNVINCYKQAAGQCVLYIPDPTATSPTTDSNGLTVPQGVSEVNAIIQDYDWVTANGVAPGLKDDATGQRDMEGDITLTLVEQL